MVEQYRWSGSSGVHPRPVTSRYGGPGETAAKRRAARHERRRAAQRIAAVLPHIPSGSRVLDVGCGDGELFRWLGNRLGLGIGIDPVLPGSIVGARYRLSKGRFPGDLPATLARFDVVTMLAVLEGVPVSEQVRLVAAGVRWLEPGGRLIFTAVPEAAASFPLEGGNRLEVGPSNLFVYTWNLQTERSGVSFPQ